MDALYPYVLLLHLLCAIILMGYLFFDVVIMPFAKRSMRYKEEVSAAIGNVITRVMPNVVLVLFTTGIIMAFRYLSLPIQSNLQRLLLVKIGLASCIFVLVVVSLSCRFILKCKNPLGKHVHAVVLTLGILIVIVAKLMFFL